MAKGELFIQTYIVQRNVLLKNSALVQDNLLSDYWESLWNRNHFQEFNPWLQHVFGTTSQTALKFCLSSCPAWAQPLSSSCYRLFSQGSQNWFSATISSLDTLTVPSERPLLLPSLESNPKSLIFCLCRKKFFPSSLLQEKFVQISHFIRVCWN